jgi:UDP-N-acetylmuramoylalanine--D-glutamate ligase
MILQNHPFLADCQSMFSDSISDKSALLPLDHFLVLGGGLSGEAAGQLLLRNGKRVSLADKDTSPKANSPFHKVILDTDVQSALQGIQMVIKSPGISPKHPILTEAIVRKIPILSEIYLGRLFFNGLIIGITGTDGKSTTTALTHHLIKAKFPNSEVGGNLGLPFTQFCDKKLDLAVLELSSYQLEDSPNLKLTSSAILTLAPDHLERHKTMHRYALAKWKIAFHENKSHTLITQKSVLDGMPEARTQFQGKLLLFGKNEQIRIDGLANRIISPNGSYDTTFYKLPGYHNLQNLSVAIALAESVGLSPLEIQSSIGTFTGLPHRFQSVSKESFLSDRFKNTNFINDSKSTNFHSMLSGISGYTKNDNLYLIVGGDPKQESLVPFFNRLGELNAKVFVYGKAALAWKNEFIAQKIQSVTFVSNIEEALIHIKSEINKDIECLVILTPAAASFDQYKNFAERGDHFVSLVKEHFGK